MKGKLVSLVAVMAIVGSALSGCGTTTTTPSDTNTPVAKAPAKTTTTTTTTTAASTKQAVADITSKSDKNINGTATLTLDTKTSNMTVTVKLAGLKPNSTHPNHIHSGTVEKPGSVVYVLNNLVADGQGSATQTTVVKNVKDIPASGWIVNIHEGPGMTGTQGDQLAAGAVTLK